MVRFLMIEINLYHSATPLATKLFSGKSEDGEAQLTYNKQKENIWLIKQSVLVNFR